MRRRLRKLFLLLLVLLVTLSCRAVEVAEEGDDNNNGEDDEEADEEADEEDDDDEYEYRYETSSRSTPKNVRPTEHQVILQDTLVDFSQTDLTGDAVTAAQHAIDTLARAFLSEGRLEELFEKTKTPECRALIAKHYGYHVMAIAKEEPLPFVDIQFSNTCEDEQSWDFDNLPKGVHMGIIQNRTYQPERNETTEHLFISPFDVKICYGILAHDNAAATIRLIEALDEPSTQFIVHIDGKYEETYQAVKEYATSRERVVVLDDHNRVRVNWGGFQMVNATMQMLNYAENYNLDFTHFIHMAATAYPIASNRRIRNTLAAYPVDANFLHIILKPNRPHHSVWNYFVECDDRLHRIHRLPPITKETHKADFYTSSQWFMISKEFASFLANPEVAPPDSFLRQYWDYIQHVVVADESFFGTVLRNTQFCNKHHNWNFLHLLFDQWENEVELQKRDERKCVMPDPNHCGRSPTTITLDQLDILEMSGDLFARKFNDEVDTKVKDVIDTLRMKEEFELVVLNATRPRLEGDKPKVDMSLEGHGTLIVAKETVNTTFPLCLGLGSGGNQVRLVPCFKDEVIPTLAKGWETGGVIMEEVRNHTRWNIGPCSSDGNLKRLDTGDVQATKGFYTPGPRCTFSIMDGIRAGRCLDGESLDRQTGGPVHVYPCTKRWNQFLSFGDGVNTPAGSIYTIVPKHIRDRIISTGREQEAYMCLGVAYRGDLDEEDWFGERKEFFDSYDIEHRDPSQIPEGEGKGEGEKYRPLVYWYGEHLMATRCSNEGAVVEWVVVPFIVEDDNENENDMDKVPQTNMSTDDTDNAPQTNMSIDVEEL